MTKSLKTLSRIKKNAIDDLRKTLGNFFNVESQLVNSIAGLDKAYLQEKEVAHQMGMIANFGVYTKYYLEKKEELNNALVEIRRQIDILQDKITEEFKEQKTFDIVDENREKAMQKELEINEQKMLDEIATNSYIRRQAND